MARLEIQEHNIKKLNTLKKRFNKGTKTATLNHLINLCYDNNIDLLIEQNKEIKLCFKEVFDSDKREV